MPLSAIASSTRPTASRYKDPHDGSSQAPVGNTRRLWPTAHNLQAMPRTPSRGHQAGAGCRQDHALPPHRLGRSQEELANTLARGCPEGKEGKLGSESITERRFARS